MGAFYRRAPFGNDRIMDQWRIILTILPYVITLNAQASTIRSVDDGQWGDQSTWNCNCTPSSSDDVIISSGDTVKLGNNQQVNDLTVRTDARR